MTEAAGQSQGSGSRLLFVWGFAALLAFTVLLVALTIPAGIYAVFSGALSRAYDYTTLLRPYLWIGPQFERLPFTLGAGALFTFLTAVYVLLLLYALRQRPGPIQAISASTREGLGKMMSSPFVVTIVAIGFLNFTSWFIDDITSAFSPIGNPYTGLDPLPVFVGFTISPLVEEFGFRLLMVGLIALILSMGRPWRVALTSLWRPSKALEGAAVGSGASIILWAATGSSALIFGACHVGAAGCGGGWDIAKFPEAAYGGIVLGYLYVRYGFHVAVLAHWGVDYFGTAFSFFGQAVSGISWDSNTTEYFGQYLVDIDMLRLFGFVSFLLVAYLVIRRLAARQTRGAVEFDKPLPGGGRVEV